MNTSHSTMHVKPIFFNEAFSDSEILEHECSDRIWLSPSKFREWTESSEPGVTTLLHLTNEEGQSMIGCVYGVHHSQDTESIFVPNWMYMELGEGHLILEKAQPSLCSSMAIQPHSSDHVSAEDPQELFRNAFENYCCLTPGTIIPLWIGKQVHVTIVELGPSKQQTLCIRNCEVTLDLMRPLDMPEETMAPPIFEPVQGTGTEPVPGTRTEPRQESIQNTIIDTRPRHVIMAEAARKRLAKTSD